VIDTEKFSEVCEHPDVNIKMKQGFVLPYYFQSASSSDASSFPLIISLHAMRSNRTVPKSRFKEWNFLYPFDCYGYKDEGSFWAAGYPKLPLMDTIVEMVERYREKNLFNGQVYISGSSSSGIACVYLANKLKAEAVYLNVPVLNSATLDVLSNSPLARYGSIFGGTDINETATKYIYSNMKTRFHIVDQRFGFKDFVAVNSFQFVGRCLELGINVHYEILPTSGHSVNYPMSHVLELFSKYPNNGRVLSTGFPALVGEDNILIDEVEKLLEPVEV